MDRGPILSLAHTKSAEIWHGLKAGLDRGPIRPLANAKSAGFGMGHILNDRKEKGSRSIPLFFNLNLGKRGEGGRFGRPGQGGVGQQDKLEGARMRACQGAGVCGRASY